MKFIRDIIRSLTMDKVEQVSNQYIKLLNDISVKIWKTDPDAEANIDKYAQEAVTLLEKFHSDILSISGIEVTDSKIKQQFIPISVTANYSDKSEKEIILWELVLTKYKSGRRDLGVNTIASPAQLHTISTKKGSAWVHPTTYSIYKEAEKWVNNVSYDMNIITI